MKRWVAKLLSVLITVILSVAIVFSELKGNRGASIVFLTIAAAAGIAFSWFLRCPHCGRWPGRFWFFYTYCPYCGEELDD